MSTKPETASTDLQIGPFEDTTTTTYELTPIKMTVIRSRKSTHVPEPEDCGCGGGGSSPYDAILQMYPAIASAVASASKPSISPDISSIDGHDD